MFYRPKYLGETQSSKCYSGISSDGGGLSNNSLLFFMGLLPNMDYFDNCANCVLYVVQW